MTFHICLTSLPCIPLLISRLSTHISVFPPFSIIFSWPKCQSFVHAMLMVNGICFTLKDLAVIFDHVSILEPSVKSTLRSVSHTCQSFELQVPQSEYMYPIFTNRFPTSTCVSRDMILSCPFTFFFQQRFESEIMPRYFASGLRFSILPPKPSS